MGYIKSFRSHTESSRMQKINPIIQQPLIEMCGNQRVLIENHLGILRYESSDIHIKVSFGYVCVKGDGMRIARMCRGKLIISGSIDSVVLHRRG